MRRPSFPSFLAFGCFCLAPFLLLACGASGGPKGGDDSLDASVGGGDKDSGVDPGFDVSSPGLDVGGSDTNFDKDAACAAKSYGGQKIPLAIAIVFDQSGSMSTGSPSRLTIARNGVEKALSDPKFDDVAVGLFRFGYSSGFNGCIWDSTPTAAPMPLSTARTTLFAELGKLKADGSTPTYDGLNAAYAWLQPKVIAKAAPYDGKTAVILVTDGAPTCGTQTPDDYVALVAKGRKANMDTFFIGLPGSDEHFDSADSSSPLTSSLMSKMAANGTDLANLPAGCDTDPSPMSSPPKVPCYFDMSSGVTTDGIAAALDNIRQVSSSCEYIMPASDPSYDSAHPAVYVTDAAGAKKDLPQCIAGGTPPAGGCWDWTDATHSHIKIFGDGCKTVQTDSKATVDILLPCKLK